MTLCTPEFNISSKNEKQSTMIIERPPGQRNICYMVFFHDVVHIRTMMTNRRSFGHESNFNENQIFFLNLNIRSRHGTLLQYEILYIKPYQMPNKRLVFVK